MPTSRRPRASPSSCCAPIARASGTRRWRRGSSTPASAPQPPGSKGRRACVARVLADAHTRPLPLLHDGIGPGNVFILPTGDVALADFGVFAAVRTLTETPIDKWLFVAPEVIQGMPSTPASDLFGLGVL